MREHAPNVYAHGDPEELHKLRVAVRRLRALLRAAGPAIEDTRTDTLRAQLRLLGGALGPARDADVFASYLQSELEGLDEAGAEPLLQKVEGERLEAYAAARTALDDPAFVRLLEALDDYVGSIDVGEAPLDELVRAEAKKLRKAMRDASSDSALHEARIKAKRVRYAAEAAGDEATVSRAKRFQDVVGEHQDAVVAERRLRELAEPETAIVVGRLIERQAARRRRARKRTSKAWKKLAKTTA